MTRAPPWAPDSLRALLARSSDDELQLHDARLVRVERDPADVETPYKDLITSHRLTDYRRRAEDAVWDEALAMA